MIGYIFDANLIWKFVNEEQCRRFIGRAFRWVNQNVASPAACPAVAL